jgi:hypothetical protein
VILMSSIATSFFMNGMARGVVAMRPRGRSPSRKPSIMVSNTLC